MSFELTRNKEILIFKGKNLPKSCEIAISSFLKDLNFLFNKPKYTNNIKIATFVLSIREIGNPESYKIKINSKQVEITGNDDLGLIYGLYTFLEDYLNVPPFYKMAHIKLTKIDSIKIPECELVQFPETRFRGWFINDEDLLCGFKSKGKRKIDYEFYHDVISPKMFKVVCETALRHKMNLIIPSTFIDVMQKAEYNLVKISSDMGLYVSQHHIEPLGVSKFGFANYVKKNNLGSIDYSFVSNREILLKVWEKYAQKWSDFPRVIWQLGLRSGLDRPVWYSEKNVGSSPEERGALISDAINSQYEIIKNNYKHEIYATSTLWMEGAELYKNNYLKLPDETIIVLSDVGMSSMFGDDFYKINRLESKNYGFYYHAAFVHTGPHCAEGVIPEKFIYSFTQAKKYNNNYYSILNVANIKDLFFSIFIHSKLCFANLTNLDDIYKKYSSFYLKDNYDVLTKAIESYFGALGDLGEDVYLRFCEKYNFSYHNYEKLPFPVVNFNDGVFRSIHMSFYFEGREKVRNNKFRVMLEENYLKMINVFEMFNKILPNIKDNYKLEFKQHWLFQSDYLSKCYKCLIFMDDGCNEILASDFKEARESYELAKGEIYKILEARKIYFSGYYKHWFKNDQKLNIAHLIEHLDEERDRGFTLKKEGKI